MNCENFNKLSWPEKVDFLGGLVHLVQCDERAFAEAQKIMNTEASRAILKDVRFTGMPTIDAEPLEKLKEESKSNSNT